MQQSEIPEPFEWDKTLSVGSKNMDKDHAELFEAIAQCDGERNSNPGLCKMRALFKLHFEAEESQMNEASYKGLAHHQLEHQQFIDRLMAVRLPFTDSFIAEAKHWHRTGTSRPEYGQWPSRPNEDFRRRIFKRRLIHHIKTTDKAFKTWKE